MSTPARRRSRARAVQITGGVVVALGVFFAVLLASVLHAPGGVRWGVGIVILGIVLLIVAAILRRIDGWRTRRPS